MTILVVCGLNREAVLAAGPGIMTMAGGGDAAALRSRLAALDPESIRAVVSFGLAGALAPDLTVGTVVTPAAWRGVDASTSVPTTLSWPDLSKSPLSAPERRVNGRDGPDKPGRDIDVGRPLTLVGVDSPALTGDAKGDLARRCCADLVDMESHLAGAYALRHGLPFGILRVVSDDADATLPEVAGRAMRPDGSVDVVGVLRGLARDPGQLPALLRTARDVGRAFRALGRVRRLLGPRLGLHL